MRVVVQDSVAAFGTSPENRSELMFKVYDEQDKDWHVASLEQTTNRAIHCIACDMR